MKKRYSIFIGLILVSFLTVAWAGEPIDALKVPVGKVLDLLKASKAQSAESQEAFFEKAMVIINETFDFEEISKRTIARHWERFNAGQRSEFTDAFAEFLGRSYYGKIRESYTDETIVFDSEETISAGRALVKTRIPRAAGDIPVYYRVMKKDGRWRVYDVLIEKVSLVKNYRTQFRSILRKESPEKLIERLKEKNRQKKDAAEAMPGNS